jgi:hypothetical protein
MERRHPSEDVFRSGCPTPQPTERPSRRGMEAMSEAARSTEVRRLMHGGVASRRTSRRTGLRHTGATTKPGRECAAKRSEERLQHEP